MTNDVDSQEKQILQYLQEGRSITAYDALKLCGCFRLSARIFDLKDKGYNIVTKMIEVNEKRIAEYKLLN